MGYRSQVAIAIEKSKAAEFEKLAEDADEIVDCGDYTVFYWNSVKWYRDFDDVEAVADWLIDIKNCAWEFIRVGESDGDIEKERSDEHNDAWLWLTNPTITW